MIRIRDRRNNGLPLGIFRIPQIVDATPPEPPLCLAFQRRESAAPSAECKPVKHGSRFISTRGFFCPTTGIASGHYRQDRLYSGKRNRGARSIKHAAESAALFCPTRVKTSRQKKSGWSVPHFEHTGSVAPRAKKAYYYLKNIHQ